MSGDAIGNSMRVSVTPSGYTEEPATLPTIVGKGRWGYRQVVAYCEETRNVHHMRLRLTSRDTGAICYRIVTLRNETGGHILNPSWDLDKLIPNFSQFEKEGVVEQIFDSLRERFKHRSRPSGVRLDCRHLRRDASVTVHFRIKFRDPISQQISDDEIKTTIEEQLKASKARLPVGYDLETLVKALRENLLDSRIAAYDARAIETYFLPTFLAKLNPNRTPEENAALSRSMVKHSVDLASKGSNSIESALVILSDGEVKNELLSSWSDGELISSDAELFRDDLLRALKADLSRLPFISMNRATRERRERLQREIMIILKWRKASTIKCGSYIDTEEKFNYLVKVIEVALPSLIPPAIPLTINASGIPDALIVNGPDAATRDEIEPRPRRIGATGRGSPERSSPISNAWDPAGRPFGGGI
jgi:hypothetical protein